MANHLKYGHIYKLLPGEEAVIEIDKFEMAKLRNSLQNLKRRHPDRPRYKTGRVGVGQKNVYMIKRTQ